MAKITNHERVGGTDALAVRAAKKLRRHNHPVVDIGNHYSGIHDHAGSC